MELVVLVIAWLVPPVICLLKGKTGMGLIGLVTPIGASILSVGVAAAVWLSNDTPDEAGWADVGALLVAALIGFALWITIVAAALLTSLIGAIRLAKPDSSWARRYDHGKLAAARSRFDVPGSSEPSH